MARPSSIIKPIGDKNYLNKKISKTHKYDKVKSTLNTGLTMEKLKNKIGEAHFNARFKRQENFKRIKRNELNLIVKEGTLDILVLDIRDAEEYETCHIRCAKSYPAPLLSRSVNQFIEVPEIMTFKNDMNKLIIIYDYNEEAAPKTANLFYEKNFDNVVMLSGGLRRFVEKYTPQVAGTPPPPPKDNTKRSVAGSTRGRGPKSTASYKTTYTTKSHVTLASSLAAARRRREKENTKPAFR